MPLPEPAVEPKPERAADRDLVADLELRDVHALPGEVVGILPDAVHHHGARQNALVPDPSTRLLYRPWYGLEHHARA